jgi:transposase
MGGDMGIKGQKRTVYSTDFKLQALQLCKQRNRTIESVALELNVPYKTLLGWKKQYARKGEQAFPGQGKVLLTPEQQRIKELEKENVMLREEREILKNRSWSPATTPKDETPVLREQTGGVGWKSSPIALVLRA